MMQRIGSLAPLLALAMVVACGGNAKVEPGGAALGGAPGRGSASAGSPAASAGAGHSGVGGGSGGAPPVVGPPGEGEGGGAGAAETCWAEGSHHAIGERFACNCNTCWCNADGTVSSTLIECNDCSYGSETYGIGETFPAHDGCNQCACETSGVSCTEKACACDPDQEWYRRYAARSPEACRSSDYACPANTTLFGNDCGCGCQQASNCPKVIDCEPGANNGCESLKAECPYSDVAG